jgi:two-component system phosphate regulon sensor histidine kinase PhoR
MKKQKIIILAIIMCLTFIGLTIVQFNYFDTLVDMRREFFEDGVKQALYRTTRILEDEEIQKYIDEELKRQGEEEKTSVNDFNRSITPIDIKPLIQDKQIIKNYVKGRNSVSDVSKNLHKEHQKTFKKQKVKFSDVAMRWSKESPEKPIEERIDTEHLAVVLRKELEKCGINIPFEFSLVNYKSERVFTSLGFESINDVHDYYSQILFPNDYTPKLNIIRVYFPTRDTMIVGQIARFAITSIVITVILFLTFVAAIFLLFHKN